MDNTPIRDPVGSKRIMTDGVATPKVLVIDDEPNIRELVQVALNFHGCAVTTGSTGASALELAGVFDPDLIVLDVLLPDIDGFEVCRRLRARANDVPVIFLTAGRHLGHGRDRGAGWTGRRTGERTEALPG